MIDVAHPAIGSAVAAVWQWQSILFFQFVLEIVVDRL